MTTLPKSLREAAEKSRADAGLTQGTDRAIAYETGFEACYAYLQEHAPEFDEKACVEFEKTFHKKLYAGVNPASLAKGEFAMATREGHLLGIRSGARWQFEQDKVWIAAAEIVKGAYENMAKELEAKGRRESK